MNEKHIRLAKLDEIDEIYQLLKSAAFFMASQKSGQWQDQSPTKNQLITDIKNNHYYVLKIESHIVGGFALLNYEADYEQLLSGQWQSNGSYLVIHRFAINPNYHRQGLAKFMLDFIDTIALSRFINSIRVDTHEKNKPMIGLLEKCQYQRVGEVLLTNYKRRLVFEKLIKAT